MKTLVLLPCMVLACASRAAMLEIELPPEVGACHSARWGSQQKYGLEPPSRGRAERQHAVMVLQAEDRLDRHQPLLKACGAQAARELDLGLVAIEPRAGTELFDRLFQRCVSSELPKVRVRVVGLKLTRYC